MKSEVAIAEIRRLFRLPTSRKRIDRYIEDELQFHLESRIADLVAHGLAPDEARRTAEREYGNLSASRVELAEVDRKMVDRRRRADWFDVLRQDGGYAIRGLRRQPVLTCTIILALGLGVGANAAVFTALDRVFLQPPPGVVDAGAVRRLYARNYSKTHPQYGPDGHLTPLFKTRDLLQLTDAARGTAQIAGDYLYRRAYLEPSKQRVLVTFVSPNYFDFLGLHPQRGRFFAADENHAGPPVPVAVISDAYWKSHFGSDPDVLGKTLHINDLVYTIVGVAPPEFEGLELEVVDMWAPFSDSEGGWEGQDALRLLARIEPGRDQGLLDQILTTQYRRTHADDPAVERNSTITTASIISARGPDGGEIPGLTPRSLALLARLGGIGLVVLIIAVANAASLLLMRALRRQREIAVRIALGISRTRLVMQLVMESTILALVAGAVALLFAELTGATLRSRLATFRWTEHVVDDRVMAFAMLVAVVGGIAAGLAPAMFTLRTDVSASLKASTVSRRGSSIRAALLVTQSGLCMALLACAGVFVQSLRRASDVDRGFDVERTMQLSIPGYYANSEEMVRQIEDRLRTMPGVDAVGRSCAGLMTPCLPTKVGPSASDTIGVGPRGPTVEFVGADFMRAAGLHAVAGRTLSKVDDAVPVAVVSQSLADALFPDGRAVGACVHVREPQSPCRSIVGVVRDVQWDITKPAPYQVYVPYAQAWSLPPHSIIPYFLEVRTRAPASAADVARLREVIAPLLPHEAQFGVNRVVTLLEPQLRPWRMAAVLFLLFGILGLVAAAAGIFGLVAYDVEQRSRELGIRIALGATSAHIVHVVVGSGLRVVAMGLGAGAVVAVLSGRVMASLLFATSFYDPTVLAATAATLVAAATLAMVVPVWRAVRLDPMKVLSSE
jgi:predicted permease